jgi:hypothetical protein
MHDDKAGLYDNDKLVGTEYSNYQADMTIYGVDEYDNKRIQFTYTKAFPTVLGNIEYNYRESTEINTSMTFVYSQLHTKLLNL